MADVTINIHLFVYNTSNFRHVLYSDTYLKDASYSYLKSPLIGLDVLPEKKCFSRLNFVLPPTFSQKMIVLGKIMIKRVEGK